MAPHNLDALLGQQEAGRVRGNIFAANDGNAGLSFRISELCWRWVTHGMLVPEGGRSAGDFRPTARGREYFADTKNDALLSLSAGWLTAASW